MSAQATAWALFHTPGLHPTSKLVLCVLADAAHNDGTRAFPSIGTISEAVGVDERNVKRHLKRLETEGLISRGDQKYTAYIPPQYRPVVYDLAMGDAQRSKNIIRQAGKAVVSPATPRKNVDKAVNNSLKSVGKAVDENVENESRGVTADRPEVSAEVSPATPNPLTQKITLSPGDDYENWATCHQCDVAKPDDQMAASGVCRDCVMHGPSSAGSPGKAALDAMRAKLRAEREAKEAQERADREALQRKLLERRQGLTSSQPTDTRLTTYGASDHETYQTGSHVQPEGVWR